MPALLCRPVEIIVNAIRNALHQIADILADAFEASADNTAPSARPARKRRTVSPPTPIEPVDEVTHARALRILRENDYRGVK